MRAHQAPSPDARAGVQPELNRAVVEELQHLVVHQADLEMAGQRLVLEPEYPRAGSVDDSVLVPRAHAGPATAAADAP